MRKGCEGMNEQILSAHERTQNPSLEERMMHSHDNYEVYYLLSGQVSPMFELTYVDAGAKHRPSASEHRAEQQGVAICSAIEQGTKDGKPYG